jgi:hypothetical protein
VTAPATGEVTGAATAGRRYRVHWLPGTDVLYVRCHCGAESRADDPVLAWDWLLAHPDGHPDAHPQANPGAGRT